MVSLYEYDQAGHMELIREEALEQGIEQGVERGISTINELNDYLIRENRIDDLRRSTTDPDFQARLLSELKNKKN